jgi:hypothetical protein
MVNLFRLWLWFVSIWSQGSSFVGHLYFLSKYEWNHMKNVNIVMDSNSVTSEFEMIQRLKWNWTLVRVPFQLRRRAKMKNTTRKKSWMTWGVLYRDVYMFDIKRKLNFFSNWILFLFIWKNSHFEPTVLVLHHPFGHQVYSSWQTSRSQSIVKLDNSITERQKASRSQSIVISKYRQRKKIKVSNERTRSFCYSVVKFKDTLTSTGLWSFCYTVVKFNDTLTSTGLSVIVLSSLTILWLRLGPKTSRSQSIVKLDNTITERPKTSRSQSIIKLDNSITERPKTRYFDFDWPFVFLLYCCQV